MVASSFRLAFEGGDIDNHSRVTGRSARERNESCLSSLSGMPANLDDRAQASLHESRLGRSGRELTVT
jgi:hypothetical protein